MTLWLPPGVKHTVSPVVIRTGLGENERPTVVTTTLHDRVGALVGAAVGLLVVGRVVGAFVGAAVGLLLGAAVGSALGVGVGRGVGVLVGLCVGASVVGAAVGLDVIGRPLVANGGVVHPAVLLVAGVLDQT